MRVKACKHCGAAFETDRTGAYLCPSCALAAKRASVLRDRVCIDCGSVFTGYPKSKRCPECQSRINRERMVANKRNGPNRKLGSIDQCQCCGKDYVVESGLQRYCKQCAPMQVAQNVKQHKRVYMKKYSVENAEAKAENRSYNKVCLVCGKVFDAETPTVTCSPECTKRLKSYRMAETDYRRGRRKAPPELKKEDKTND